MEKRNCPRRYHIWSDEEYEALALEFRQGWTISEMMKHHRRNLGGISAALVRLELVHSRKECRDRFEAGL